jgi:hypothetical protein
MQEQRGGKDRRAWLLTMVFPGAMPCAFVLGGLMIEGQRSQMTESEIQSLMVIASGLIVLVPLWLWAAVSSVKAASQARAVALAVGQ